VKLFERTDPFDRFASVLLFVPRERYDSDLRKKAGELLVKAYGGRLSAYYPSFNDTPLARVHYIIGFTPGPPPRPRPAQGRGRDRRSGANLGGPLRQRRARQRPHSDAVAETAGALPRRLPAGYRDRFDAAEALDDVAVIEGMAEAPDLRARLSHAADGPLTSASSSTGGSSARSPTCCRSWRTWA
jgi:glutamate dehydrogenase